MVEERAVIGGEVAFEIFVGGGLDKAFEDDVGEDGEEKPSLDVLETVSGGQKDDHGDNQVADAKYHVHQTPPVFV